MAVSVRLTEQDEQLFKAYAKSNNISLSDLIRNAVMEKIEDEYDLAVYRESLQEYNNHPISYSHADVCRLLGID